MSTPILLQSQKNAVHLTIKESGLNPLEFDLIDPQSAHPRGTRFIARLVHLPSASWFIFDRDRVSYSPAKETQEETVATELGRQDNDARFLARVPQARGGGARSLGFVGSGAGDVRRRTG